MVSRQFHYTKRNRFMPFLLAEILNFQGSTHRIGVGSFSYIYLDSGKINDGKNKYEGGINESIFRGKIAQWGVTFDDVNLKKVKPWEEIL